MKLKVNLTVEKKLDDIEVDFYLSKMKPLHAQWLISMYNHVTSEKGKQIVLKGWKKAGTEGVFNGELILSLEDPYKNFTLEFLALCDMRTAV